MDRPLEITQTKHTKDCPRVDTVLVTSRQMCLFETYENMQVCQLRNCEEKNHRSKEKKKTLINRMSVNHTTADRRSIALV